MIDSSPMKKKLISDIFLRKVARDLHRFPNPVPSNITFLNPQKTRLAQPTTQSPKNIPNRKP